MRPIQDYIINFFAWYYLYIVKNFAASTFNNFVFQLNKTNTLSMVKNISKPLYQDESSLGKSMSVFIRFWWIGFGTINSVLRSIPQLIIFIIIVVLPIIPIVQLIRLFIK